MNIIRFYNQNRRYIWRVATIILAIFILIQLLNYLTIKKNEKIISEMDTKKTENNTSNYSTDSKYTSNKSVVNNRNVNKNKMESTQEVLDKFFSNCNNQKLQEAYDLLTDECKELVYPSLDSFKTNYYNNMFGGKIKNYSFENWYDNTYYITINEDILSTGKFNSDEDKLNDYVTIVGDKLNINTYVGREKIDKEVTRNDIQMIVNTKDTFMNYEIYNITVKNNSSNTICITTADDSDDVYIQDENNVKYGVYNHEIIASKMIIPTGSSRNLSFKFYSSYISTKKISRLVFKNLILDNSNNKKKENIYEYRINF